MAKKNMAAVADVDAVDAADKNVQKVRCTLAFRGLPLYGQSSHKLANGSFVILQLGRIESFPDEIFRELQALEPHLVELK